MCDLQDIQLFITLCTIHCKDFTLHKTSQLAGRCYLTPGPARTEIRDAGEALGGVLPGAIWRRR